MSEQPEPAAHPTPVADERFAGSLGPAPSGSGGGSPFSGGGPSQFGGAPSQFGPPPSQFGAPPSQFGPPPSQFGAPPSSVFGAAPVAGFAPGSPHARTSRTGLVVAAVVAGVVVLGVLVASVAIPVLREARARAAWSATTFSTPTTVDGEPQLSGVPKATDFVPGGEMLMEAQFPQLVQAAYGVNGRLDAVVLAGRGRRYLSLKDQNAFLSGALDHGPPQLRGQWKSAPAGRLGGQVRCGVLTSTARPVTLCFSVDGAGFTMVVVADADGAAKARRVREAIEQRS